MCVCVWFLRGGKKKTGEKRVFVAMREKNASDAGGGAKTTKTGACPGNVTGACMGRVLGFCCFQAAIPARNRAPANGVADNSHFPRAKLREKYTSLPSSRP